MKKKTYLLVKFNETHLSNTMLNNQFKHFTIQVNTSNKSASMNEDLSLLVEKDQSKSAIEDEVMQNDNYMILPALLI